MAKLEYSAGMVKHSFWFNEFRKMIGLLLEGSSWEEIKRLCQEENIFSVRTVERANHIYRVVANRVNSLDRSIHTFFYNGELSTQKIIVLISIMKTDKLFFDFVYEVYYEKIQFGNNQLSDGDIQLFLRNKQVQSERVAKWTDETLKRLGRAYKTILIEAGVLIRGSRDNIQKPILDIALKSWLMNNQMQIYLDALTGGER
ncbi:DUF1819 family protein [Paenibacillus sp. MER TA 81-3]|uniref:DUF1819 family protein n=1 Tax=Paenibacillus sp. MER TA 81-3 TaxID=2939573 RepID=UPI002041B57E|nr:DUF1819 family protein [Paenibacillus sp. MER TA 81-3]MCM3342064.1 DUF1819 family protein [Paenibacillus sp. MER TA 81-3]